MSGTMGSPQFSRDPTNLDDPNHPLSPLGAGFEKVRQRRLAHDARQMALAQLLAAPPAAGPAGAGGIAPLPAGGWGGATPGWSGQGLTGLAEAANRPNMEWNSKLGQNVDTNQGPGWYSDMFRQGGAKAGGGGFGGGGV